MGILVALPIAAAIALHSKKKIEEFFFLSISIIILFILIASYTMKNASMGVIGAIASGILSAVYCVVIFIFERERFKKYVLTPGLFVMATGTVISGIMFINKTDLGDIIDSFRTHAPQVLYMYRFSGLITSERIGETFGLLYNAPIYNSWSYFCNVLWFDYSDGINLWAKQIFIMSAYMPLFSFVGGKEWKKIILISFVIMLIPGMIVPSYYYMHDIPLGAMMLYGTLMLVMFYTNKEKYNEVWYLLAGCLCLLYTYLLKRLGGSYAFGMIGVVTVFTVNRLINKNDEHRFFIKIMPLIVMAFITLSSLYFIDFRNRYYIKDNLITVLPIVAFFTFVVMGIYCYFLKRLFSMKKYPLVVFALLMLYVPVLLLIQVGAKRITKGNPDSVKEVFFSFFSLWFNSEHGEVSRFGGLNNISDFAFVLILLVVVLFVRALVLTNKLSYTGTIEDFDSVVTSVFVGYTIHMIIWCLLCMYRQGGYASDGEIYHNTRYYGPAIMLVAGIVLYVLLMIKSVYADKIILLAAVFFVLLLPRNPFAIMGLSSEPYWEKYADMCQKAGVELTEDNDVLCIGPDHVYYYVFPARAYQDTGAIAGNDEPDVFAARAMEYDYLIIEETYRKFSYTYQDMFEGGIDAIQDYSVYDIKVDENNNVTFVRREADRTE